MSIAIMTQVWALPLPTGEKIVLLALADQANDTGHCWPSMATIAKRAGMTDRGAQLIVQRLEAAGHLHRAQVPGKGCNYYIHPQAPSGMQGYTPPEFHYVYRIENTQTGEFYIGARSCLCAVEDDSYMGSGVWVKQAILAGDPLRKTILQTCVTREELGHAERRHVEPFYRSELCRNAKMPSAGNLTKTGFRGDTPEPRSPRTTFPPNYDVDTPEPRSPKPSVTLNTSKKATPSHSQRARSKPTLSGFAEFWAAYPRRTAKAAAERAWPAACKRAEPAQIIAAARRYAADPPDDPQYIPHPATWLNQARFEDEPTDGKPIRPLERSSGTQPVYRPNAALDWLRRNGEGAFTDTGPSGGDSGTRLALPQGA